MERFSTEHGSPDDWVEEVGEISTEQMELYKAEILKEIEKLHDEEAVLISWLHQANVYIKKKKNDTSN